MYIKYGEINVSEIINEWEARLIVKNKDIFKEVQKCFHYTTLDTFWKIINSETFRATHIKFSNDSQESNEGHRIMKSLFLDCESIIKNSYMICFCMNNDILSQWREYGKKRRVIRDGF